MDQVSSWRKGAKVVAIIDMVILFILVLAVTAIFILASWCTVTVYTNPVNETTSGANLTGERFALDTAKNSSSYEFCIHHFSNLWSMSVLNALLVAVQMWAAKKLFNATKVDVEVEYALKMSLIWRNVAVATFAILLIGSIILKNFNVVRLIILMVWRVPSIILVCIYMKRLQTQIISPAGKCNP